MSLTSLPGILQQQGAAGPAGFFGSYSMLREFWAEDPSWTNPGDSNDMVSWRDNGSLATDATEVTEVAGVEPIYVDTGIINSKPAIRFNPPNKSTASAMRVTTGSPSGGTTVVAVAQSLGVLQDRRVVDAGNVSGGLMLIELQKVAPDMWRAYNSSTLNATGGTTDTAAHLFVVRYDTNDCELWVDGTSVASDTSGTYDVPIGIAIGSDRGVTTTAWIGDIPYVAQYDGDLEADGGFSSWANSIANYYGLTEGW